MFSDERDQAYARINKGGHTETWPLGSHRFRTWLSHEFYTRGKEVASSSVLSDALGVIYGRALHDSPTRHLSNRFARHDDALWYDLGDERWRAIRIGGTGWTIEDDPPPLFRRYSHQLPQVVPEHGGAVSEVLDLLNITGADHRILVQVWLVAALLADVPRAVLIAWGAQGSAKSFMARDLLNITGADHRILVQVWLVAALLADVPRAVLIAWGAQGSAKSFMARVLRMLVDPSAVPMPRFPRGDSEMAQVLDHHAAFFFDNLSGLNASMSDTLCRAVTGDGFQKRRLYSDDEDVIYEFKRVILLNGISVPAQRPDLLDRSVLVKLPIIAEDERREGSELVAAFMEARPRIFGAMLTALSQAIAIRPNVQLGRHPRMADWSTWGYAIAEALGIGGEAFLGAYERNRQEQNQEALSSHPVGAAVMAFMVNRDTWSGVPSALLENLEKVAEANRIDTHSKMWPGSASWLTRRLGEVETNLRR